MTRKKELPKAAALKYRPDRDAAPRVTARGSGLVAEKIIDLARLHGIPLKQDPALIQVLSQLDLNQEIPPAIYVVVAEVLAFVYSLNRGYAATAKQPNP
jgi:flagellar biosynthesis protein